MTPQEQRLRIAAQARIDAQQQRLRIAAKKHAMNSAYLLGYAAGMKAHQHAAKLGWGKATNVTENQGHLVIRYGNHGTVTVHSITGATVIHPAG